MAQKQRTGERLRLLQEREVHQYFHPWLIANGSAFNVASNVDSIALQDLQELGYVPQRSQDKSLAAFAQLAPLRLNVRRAMVSLIDSRHQYILIEATKTLSFLADHGEDKSDDLWLGNAILNRDDAVCHHCFTNTYSVSDKHGQIYQTRGLVVNDCRQDSRFKDRSYVTSEPGVRFYAGVPIVTRSGLAIGAYAVSDESPRNGLSIEEMKYMEDVAVAITEHLERAKDRVDRFKADRIIRGLGSFIDRSKLGHTRQTDAVKMDSTGDKAPVQGNEHMDRISTETRDDFVAEFGPAKHLALDNDHDTLHSESESDLDSKDSNVTAEPGDRSRDVRQQENLHQLLTRAARNLRRSTLADGVIFFEALEDPISDQDIELVGKASESRFSGLSSTPSSADVSVLSVSLRAKPGEQSAATTTLKRSTFARYFQLFPVGKAFHFTADGTEIESDEDDADGVDDSFTEAEGIKIGTKRKTRSVSRAPMSHGEVLAKLRGVRELVFLPLRDFITGKWIAGGFLWSNTFGRMMDMGQDLPHLNAFANGIVSEVVRMNVEQLSRSKTAFIASMSHELRSPLHGILGSVEFINDTKTSSYQAGLITAIANCSRTLLDTLSNLLSYAKVSQTEPTTVTTRVDLALLVEEVVESVCAGHAFRKEHTAGLTALPYHNSPDLVQHAVDKTKWRRRSQEPNDTYTQTPGDVGIVLDIAMAADWHVPTNPGAIRRVVMNLVGNALKYTSRGYISISLRLLQNQEGPEAVIQVADSGKGISGSFLKSNLFVPFKQEDSFSAGTGLGLSIVKQLAESLDGTVRVQSVLGKGTEFQVNIPIQNPGSSLMTEHEHVDDASLAIVRDTATETVSIVSPDGDKSLASNKTRASLTSLCETWFYMDVIKTVSSEIGDVDIVILTRPVPMGEVFEKRTRDGLKRPKGIIVLCCSATDAVKVTNEDTTGLASLGHIVEVISQPCGPRKLAQALKRCLERHNESLLPTSDSLPAPPLLTQPISGLAIHGPPSPEVFSSSGRNELTGPPPPQPSSSSSSSSSHPSSHQPTKRVLIVDDNKINRDLMSHFVAKFGLAHECAVDGADAVRRFQAAYRRAEGFDYVLIDVNMPVMDGLQATREIRQFETEQQQQQQEEGHGRGRARIVALTGCEAESTQVEARDSGVDVYLSKPVRFAKLKEILQNDFGLTNG